VSALRREYTNRFVTTINGDYRVKQPVEGGDEQGICAAFFKVVYRFRPGRGSITLPLRLGSHSASEGGRVLQER